MNHFGAARNSAAILGILLYRVVDSVEYVLVPERFLNELKSTLLHGLHRHGNIAMTGYKNDRQHRANAIEVLLHLQTAHVRHADIKHEAAR